MSSSAIKYAVVKKSTAGQWDVYYTTTARGAVLWDHVAKQNFHGLLAIDLRGVVYSAPIIQPTQASFSSFKGRGQISGNLTKADAERLANALSSRR
jgi:preprotein translocase subunit SecD